MTAVLPAMAAAVHADAYREEQYTHQNDEQLEAAKALKVGGIVDLAAVVDTHHENVVDSLLFLVLLVARIDLALGYFAAPRVLVIVHQFWRQFRIDKHTDPLAIPKITGHFDSVPLSTYASGSKIVAW